MCPSSTLGSYYTEGINCGAGARRRFNLEGTRELVDSGQIVRAGDYVYEPAGNADTWRVVGDGPCTVFIVTRGAMEYLDDEGAVLRRDTTETMRETYVRFCESEGIEITDLEG